MLREYRPIRLQTALIGLLAIALMSGLVLYSYQWNVDNLYREKLTLALDEARSIWNKDAAFRKWATLHGGLYVKPDERTPPNPYLAHIPNRDVVTSDGTQLTLMNPAYMMRQMTEEFEKTYGVKGKITGKVQLNPLNKPDAWQDKVLTLFEQGEAREFYEQQSINETPYLRYMKPMFMTQGCVKCHGHLGFKDGDLRGGVSVSIPLQPYFSAAGESQQGIWQTHLAIWIVGVIAILVIALLIQHLLTRMAHESMHDELTGLPNYKLFKNRLEQAFRQYQRDPQRLFAVCFLDLDEFKNLNDSRGHTMGNMLLQSLAIRLQSQVRPTDTLARLGGDEFTLLLEEIEDVDAVIRVIERVLRSFSEPFQIQQDEIFSSASVGICLVSGDYQSAQEVLRDADIAMYKAKEEGQGRKFVFNPDLRQHAMETMQIENDLNVALEKGQFEIHYQPVVDIVHNRITSFEALLRWRHPQLGYIPPDRFIPVAEHSGKIHEIGLWVMREASQQVREWTLQFSAQQPFAVAVNLSAVQLVETDLVSRIQQILAQTRLSVEQLKLEVTESMLVAQKEPTKAAIEAVRQLGINVSIDDFGKGYCSLSYLQEFNFDTLKIDKDYVQDIKPGGNGIKLVRTLMLLARDLELDVIAEGVETLDQLNRLNALGCRFVQGFYFCKPLPAAAMMEKLDSGVHENARLMACSDQNDTHSSDRYLSQPHPVSG